MSEFAEQIRDELVETIVDGLKVLLENPLLATPDDMRNYIQDSINTNQLTSSEVQAVKTNSDVQHLWQKNFSDHFSDQEFDKIFD